MTLFKKIFGRSGQSKPVQPQNDKLKFIVMQGNDFTELSTFNTMSGTCAVCGKDAAVITANIADVRKLPTGSVHYPAKLGIKGWKQIPEKSSKLAAYCERCQGYYHLCCVEALTLVGSTLFRCPKCISDLGPAPQSLNFVETPKRSVEDHIKNASEGNKSCLRLKFTNEEWALMRYIPIDMYYQVATADGGCDHEATVLFGNMLVASAHPDPLLAALAEDISSTGSSGLDDLLKTELNDSEPDKLIRMDRTKAILKGNLNSEEYQSFLGLVLVMGLQLAKASGGQLSIRKKQAMMAFGDRYEIDPQAAMMRYASL